MEQPSYYAVIPSNVRYDNNLKGNEKLLYGEITALSNKNGYCTASNNYFAGLYGKHKDTISDWITNLTKKEYIKTQLIHDDLGRIKERRIYLSAKMPIPYRQKHLDPIGENALDNNTSINNNKEEEGIKKVIKFYENNIALITPYVFQNIEKYIDDGIEEQLIITALEEAVSRNKRNWNYVKSILNNCLNNNIKTKHQYEVSQREYKENLNKNKQKEMITETEEEKKARKIKELEESMNNAN